MVLCAVTSRVTALPSDFEREGRLASNPELTDSVTHKTKETGLSSLLGAGGGVFPFPMTCLCVTDMIPWGWRMKRV